MKLTMMAAAEGYGKLITDLAAESTLLREAQMMSVRGYSTADQTVTGTSSHSRSRARPIGDAQ
jgi:hypothetical protein